MTNEQDLKKVELKVSVNCCDGCRRKIKKVLRSIEGVLHVDIDAVQPKVTVVGNVDQLVLIKRLLRAGKQAEPWSHSNQKAGQDKNQVGMPLTKKRDNDKSKSASTPQPKSSETNATKNVGDTCCDKKKSKDDKPSAWSGKTITPPMEAAMIQDLGNFRICNPFYYKVEPCAIALPYCAIPSYAVAPLPITYYGQQECLQQQNPMLQPQLMAPATRVGDYFNDENTMGCHVM